MTQNDSRTIWGDVVYYGGYVVMWGADNSPYIESAVQWAAPAYDWASSYWEKGEELSSDVGKWLADKMSEGADQVKKGFDWVKEKLGGGGAGSQDPNKWNKGGFDSAQESLERHFGKHGAEVGAKDVEQYIRKAVEFSKNLKGATKYTVDGVVDGVVRYVKNGRYIDLAPDGTIISFGKR